jgi:transcriptional regulator with XRE-family HTH domain
MPKVDQILIEQIIAERKARGISQVRLAKALKQHQSWVSRLENGERRIAVEEFVELGKKIGFNPVHVLRRVMKTLNAA